MSDLPSELLGYERASTASPIEHQERAKFCAPDRVRACRLRIMTRPLQAGEWALIHAFVARIERDALRLRFGHSADFTDAAVLKRLFEIEPATAEQLWMLDGSGAIAGI